ncbi:hypothetical protein D9613_002439 [Agrocybe pediades]|uniref:rRNA 2'-O-methyltransferase fibrillarin n=1 Tax=Agrocybe pediades TaxID=84607 RepID=A0A8H4QP53_9AGAR|nr:hypothetical protein D9613_002439 [Agrocybe pediades]
MAVYQSSLLGDENKEEISAGFTQVLDIMIDPVIQALVSGSEEKKKARRPDVGHEKSRPWGLCPDAKVLYLGAASGTSVNHVADIVAFLSEGNVYAVEFSPRSGRDLINMAKKRTNVIPVEYL